MKKLSTFIICLLAASQLFAQDCSNFIYLQKGKTIEMTTFNAAGKVMHKLVDFVSDVSVANGTTTATVSSQTFDGNGQAKGTRNVSYQCTGGVFSVDVTANSPQAIGNGKVNGSYMQYPSNMKVGDHFPDATVQMELNVGNRTMSMVENITNRTVVDKESVTTPAGTWDAFKITYTVNISTHGGPMGMGPPTAETTQWFVPGFGIVQYKVYNMTVQLTSLH